MEQKTKSEKVIIEVGPPGKPYAKIIRTERRFCSGDRRTTGTYIADDRRNGIADRRNTITFRLKKPRTEDRRQLHKYIANDRRKDIENSRDPKRIIPPWWRFNLR